MVIPSSRSSNRQTLQMLRQGLSPPQGPSSWVIQPFLLPRGRWPHLLMDCPIRKHRRLLRRHPSASKALGKFPKGPTCFTEQRKKSRQPVISIITCSDSTCLWFPQLVHPFMYSLRQQIFTEQLGCASPGDTTGPPEGANDLCASDWLRKCSQRHLVGRWGGGWYREEEDANWRLISSKSKPQPDL